MMGAHPSYSNHPASTIVSSVSRRRQYGITRALFVLAFVAEILTAGIARAQDEPEATSSVDWENATLTLTVSVTVPQTGPNLPAGSWDAERRIQDSLSDKLHQALFPIQVDSAHTIADVVSSDPLLVRSFAKVAQAAKKGFVDYSPDLQKVSVPYTIPLFPEVGSLFIRQTSAVPLNRSLGWTPTADFTGVVIYAKGQLPLHGTSNSALVLPCLFPTIYDENMRVVVQKKMMDPQQLDKWGAVAYTPSVGENRWQSRIGLTPLRIVATGVFGVAPCDIIISTLDADRLLSTEHNRQLLADGRILIIYGSD